MLSLTWCVKNFLSPELIIVRRICQEGVFYVIKTLILVVLIVEPGSAERNV